MTKRSSQVPDRTLYTTSPAAAKAGCSVDTIRRFANEGFTDKLRAKHTELEAELERQNERLAHATGVVDLPREIQLREGLVLLRQNLGKLHELARSPHATPTHVARLRSALEDFLGEVPLRPDYKAGALIATVGPKKEALALLDTGTSAAFRNGSGGRI